LLAVAACILVGFAFQLSFSRKTAIAALEARSMILGAIVFGLRLCRLPGNHALQAAGVDRHERIDPDLAGACLRA
jgi:hypothetical protein